MHSDTQTGVVNKLLFPPKRLVEKVRRPNKRGKVVIMRWLAYTFHDICPQLPPPCRVQPFSKMETGFY